MSSRGLRESAVFAFFLALSLASREARAADPAAPRIGIEPTAASKVERFLSKLPAEDAGTARARLRSGELKPRDLIHALLLERDERYRSAVEAFSRDGANAEEFLDLVSRAKKGPLAAALEAHASFFAGRAFLNRSEFDRAARELERVQGELAGTTPWTDEATLDLAQCYLRRPEADPARKRLSRARARACLEALAPKGGGLAVYSECPERERDMAALLLVELDGPPESPWQGLSRELERIKRSIESELSGKPLERKHEQMLAAAERLLDLVRESGGDEDAPRRVVVRLPKKPRSPESPETKDWGTLSPQERAQALSLLKERFPERYRELIEQYMKVIANGTQGEESPPRRP